MDGIGEIGRDGFAKALLTAAALVLLWPTAASAAAGDHIPGHYICVFKPGPISAGLEARQSVAAVGGSVTHVYSHVLNGFAAAMSATAAQQIRRHNPLIDYCEQDRIASVNARPGSGGGGTTQPAQTIGWNITRIGGARDGTGKTAWVIDTGLAFGHPDLITDQGRSKSFLTNDTSASDANGHGTHVGGIIGALNNNIGVVGVAAGATLVSLRVLDSTGNGPDSGVIAALEYLYTQLAVPSIKDVANLSLETGVLDSLDAAVIKLGTLIPVVSAAGNDFGNASGHSPGRANGQNVYTVTAFDQGDTWSFYSNYGKPPIDYIEPGGSIRSTVLNGGYGTKSGTSMAAPHLAGLLLTGLVVPSGTVTRPGGETYVVGAH